MTFHFDCIFYYVSDLDRAIAFYRDVLGFRLVSRDIVARFNVDGVLFELVPSAAKTNRRDQGNARLCMRVDNVEKALVELKSQAVRTDPAVQKSTGVLASFHDPDGNEICLWQYALEESWAEEEKSLFKT